MGSVRATLSDAGIPQAAASYDAWGVPETPAIASFGFTGELQQGSDVWLRARWYGAGRGSFGSRDAFAGDMSIPQSLHHYTYTHNNPVNFTDPTGFIRWSRDGSTPPYHDWIESQYERTDPVNIHIEFDWLRVIQIDLLNPSTGDVYEIEPIDKLTTGFIQVTAYIQLLRIAQGFSHLEPEWRGWPKTSRVLTSYHWNHVFWQYGASSRYPGGRWNWEPFSLVAMSPSAGLIAYWLEPRDASAPAWVALAKSKNRDALKRPYGWQSGMAVPGLPTSPHPNPPAIPPVIPPFIPPARNPGGSSSPSFPFPKQLDSGICP